MNNENENFINPLLKNNFDYKYINESNNEIINLTIDNIFLYYKKVYFLVKKNDNNIPFDYYKINVNQELYNNVSNNLILYEINTINLKNQNNFNNILIISKKDLDIFNIFNYNLEDLNLVIPIFNITFLNTLVFFNQFENQNTLKNIFNIIILNKYFNHTNNDISNSILDLEESKYWKYNKNLLLNLTEKFKNIYFKFNSSRITDKNVKKIFINKNDDNYNLLNDNKCTYTDISSVIYNDTIYKINNIEYTNNDINRLFDSLTENNKFLLFCQLSISKEYCNLVINNKYILQIMNTWINNYPHIIRYVLSYAWIKFYTEECIQKINIKQSDTFIFDIETASLLPLFPFNYSNPKLNPYMPILIADNVLQSYKNFNGIYDYSSDNSSNMIRKGICNLEEFKYRMNIFCTGNSNNNIFKNINFDELGIAITGSIMTACLQKHNPLITHFYNKNEIITDETYDKFFNEYYIRSDIDIMFKKSNIIDFLKKSNLLYNQITKNILNIYSDATDSDVNITINKVAYMFIDPNYVTEHINVPNISKKNIINYINNNINTEEIKLLFKPLYEKLKNEYHNKLLNDLAYNEIALFKQKYPQLFIYDNIDYIIYINNKYINNTNIMFNYKFKITSKYLKRPLELFQIKYDNFFSTVSQFHVACVRSYYTGDNVYMTPSCITAHMTFMNIDNKYVASKKDPLEILLKYRSRGFGAWLSPGQLKIMKYYCSSIPYWSNLYIKPISNKIGKFNKNFTCGLELNNMCFFPRFNNKIYFSDINKDENITYNINSNESNINIINDQSLSFILKLRYKTIKNENDFIFDKINNLQIINSDGFINKPQLWIFHYIYNMLNDDNLNHIE
jgi:hypothetical protein